MFIKKIVSWISENPPEGSSNESIMGESEKSFKQNADTIKTDDNWSSTSTGGQTSTLDGILSEHGEITGPHEEEKLISDSDSELGSTFTPNNDISVITFKKEHREHLFSGGDSAFVSIVPKNIDKISAIESKIGQTSNSHFEQERSLLIRNADQNMNLLNEVDSIKGADGVSASKLSSLIRSKPQHFSKQVTDCNSPSSSTGSKSNFIQEKVGAHKLCGMIMKNSSNCSTFDVLESQKKNIVFPVYETSLSHYTEKYRKGESSQSLYGMLFVVGCSKVVPTHLAEKMNTKYILRKRPKANGLTEASYFVTSDVKESLAAFSTKHAITYPLDNYRSVVVAFKHDSLSDLFEIGRYEKYPIDFTVDDTNPLEKVRHGVSRFACRISVRRDEHKEARIFAGAFNSSGTISVCDSDLAHDYCGKMDGFTTNGVLILKPNGKSPGNWREVSISGYIYELRSSKMNSSKRPRIEDESNVLCDGTLIDLCGVTLIWRTPDGLKKVPSEHYLNHLQSTLHKHSPECSLLSLNSVVLESQTQRVVKKAYVYLSCGHVVGLVLSQPRDNCGKGWSCPNCRVIGPIKEFTIGTEPGFYFDNDEVLSYAAFKPCGHVASQNTVEFWSSIDIPNHRSIHCSLCPFCGQKLNFITKYVKLDLPII